MFGIKFQSTRPVRGATPTSSKSSKTNSTFQSTRPVRGATRLGAGTVLVKEFQSTRPVRGATCMFVVRCSCMKHFNPRAPCGARPPGTRTRERNDMISIHAPRAGRDSRPALPGGVVRAISIHAPRAGRDLIPGAATPVERHFNPRAPCGARPHPRKHPRLLKKFQSTRPVRGATMKGAYRWRLKHNFNPRAPCGARPASTAGTIGEVTFQSTRPVRGATKAFEGQHPTYEFQSTRPVRGATTLCSPR